jgi:hypothetical protein
MIKYDKVNDNDSHSFEFLDIMLNLLATSKNNIQNYC